MDQIVLAAMQKWPHVPACYGWLGLDARGDWYMRDEATQARGPFAQAKGSRIEHPRLKAFIERNYTHNEHGAWYFQNGPQRVYVELEAAPWVWRISLNTPTGQPLRPENLQLHSHTGQPTELESAWLDEQGRLFLNTTPLGLGLVHSQDMHLAALAIEHELWPHVSAMGFNELVRRFAYQLKPQNQAITQ